MKQYKLIKEYPGSYKLNSIAKERTFNSVDYNIIGESLNFYEFKISRKIVENSPEYWQEIKEKEYQILQLKQECNNEILSFFDNKCINRSINKHIIDSTVTLEECLSNNYSKNTIYSIKRLSDGEVFTIGDKIIGTASIDENLKLGPGYTTINRFEIKDDLLVIGISTGIIYDYRNKYDDKAWTFLKIKKYIPKQKLFTTEDGVDIFEGDKFWIVSKTAFTLNSSDPSYCTIYTIRGFLLDHWIPFSSKLAAQEYIIMNKPCLSYNDFLGIQDKYLNDFMKLTNIKCKIKEKLGISN